MVKNRLGVKQTDEGEMTDSTLKPTIRGDQLQIEFLRKPNVQGVIERQLVAGGQADDRLGQLSGGHEELKLEIVEGEERLFDVALRKAGIVEQKEAHV